MDAWHACANPKLRSRSSPSIRAGWASTSRRSATSPRSSRCSSWAPQATPPSRASTCPEETIEKSPIAQMSGWVEEGHLIKTDGNIADFLRIEDDIVDLVRPPERAGDLLRSRARLADAAVAAAPQGGRPGDPHRQPEPAGDERGDAVARAARDGGPATCFEASRQPVLHLDVQQRRRHANYKDEIYPRKAGGKDSPNKIDGPVATFNALSVAETAEGEAAPRLRRGRRVHGMTDQKHPRGLSDRLLTSGLLQVFGLDFLLLVAVVLRSACRSTGSRRTWSGATRVSSFSWLVGDRPRRLGSEGELMFSERLLERRGEEVANTGTLPLAVRVAAVRARRRPTTSACASTNTRRGDPGLVRRPRRRQRDGRPGAAEDLPKLPRGKKPDERTRSTTSCTTSSTPR
jgi:hypothetical protein